MRVVARAAPGRPQRWLRSARSQPGSSSAPGTPPSLTTQQLPPTTTHPLGLRPGGAAGAEQLAAIERLAAEVDASAAEGRLQEGVGGLLSRLAAEAARAGLDRFDEAAHTGLWRASTLLTAENRNAVGVAHATLDELTARTFTTDGAVKVLGTYVLKGPAGCLPRDLCDASGCRVEDCSSPAFYACVTEIQAAGVRGATALLGRFEVAAPDTVRVTFDSASLALGGAPGEVRPLRSGPAVVEQRIVCMAPGLHVTRSAAGTAVLRRVR